MLMHLWCNMVHHPLPWLNMGTSRSGKGKHPEGRNTLLRRARSLAEQQQISELLELAPQVAGAPPGDLVALSNLVGPALTDFMCCEQALAMYKDVLGKVRNAEDRAVLMLHRARAFHELFDVDRGLEEVARASRLLGAGITVEQEAFVLTVKAALLSSQGQQADAEGICLRAIEQCDDPALAPLAVDALVVFALIALRRGRLEEAERRARRAVDHSDHSMGTRRADALRTLAVVSANRNEFLLAIVSCRQALRIYGDQRSRRGRFKGYLSLGISYLTMGELDHAELFFDKCYTIAESGSDLAPRSLASSRLGHVYLARGEPGDALVYYRQDLELSKKLNNPVSMGHPELNTGEALLGTGEVPEAIEHLERALGRFEAVNDKVWQARAHLALARAHCQLLVPGEAEPSPGSGEAEHHLGEARKLVVPLDRMDLTCHCDVVQALILAAGHRVQEAMTHYRAGVSVMERLEMPAEATHATFRMGDVLEAIGARVLAVKLYSDALRNAELHQFRGLRRQLLKRLVELDENVVVDRSLGVGSRQGLSSRDLLRRKVRPEDIRGSSRAIKQVRKLIHQVAPTDVPVLVEGESGTGKELVARAIHFASKVCAGPLEILNCGAIPEGLVESELFGHAEGSFTGAVRTHTGCLERAHNGTVFLDEIGDLPGDAQVKLLRFLSTGEVRKVGETKSKYVNVRVMAATYRDLRERVQQKKFRQDLYFRLNIFEIHTPPLRQISGDVPRLAKHFLDTEPLARERNISRISPRAMEALVQYRWPGNVRELENAIRRACVVCTGPSLLKEHLPDSVVHGPGALLVDEPRTLEQWERAYIREVLARCNGNQSQAAEVLDIHRNTLRRKLAE